MKPASEPTPFQKMDSLMRHVISVPKKEMDRRVKEASKERQKRKKST